MNVPARRVVRIRPVTFVYRGNGVMASLPRFMRMCDEQYLVDDEYPMTLLDARSRVSHSHYFACIHECWENMPEGHDFKNEIAMRKHALIETGWCTTRTIVTEDERAAVRSALKAEADEYAIIEVKGNVVRIHEAVSQSAAAMGRDEFMASKRDVLELLAALVGTTVKEISKAAEQHFRPEPARRA
jgi:hypothetical protein